MSSSRLFRSLVAVLALQAISCLAQPTAALRLAHLSPDAPRVDLVVNRQLFLRDVTYGQVTPYHSLPAGQHEISVYPHRLPQTNEDGAEGPRSLEPLTMLVEFEDGMYYTLAVSGFYQQPSDDQTAGSLAVDVEPADSTVRVTGPRGFSESFSGQGVLNSLEPGDYSVRAEREGYSPAAFEITVRQGETATVSISLQEGDGEVTDREPSIGVEGTSATWRPIELHAFRDELSNPPPPGGSRIRLIHLSPATVAVDLLALPEAGGEAVMLASGLSFPNGSAYTRLPGREFTLQVRIAGTDAILAEYPQLTVDPGAVYTLFLVREPQDNYLRLVPSVDVLFTVRR